VLDVSDCDLRSFSCEELACRCSDAVGAACDERDFPFYSSHVMFHLFFLCAFCDKDYASMRTMV